MKDKITIVSIARDLGIAPSTVSRAFDPTSRISSSVRKKILDYAESVGYVPNRAAARLSMGQLKVGVAIKNHYSYGVSELLRGIKDAYQSLLDYKLSLKIVLFNNEKNLSNEYADVFDALADCDCLLLSGFDPSCAARVINPIAKRIPTVILQSDIEGIEPLFTSIIDTVSSTTMAADVLGFCLRSSLQKRVALFTGSRTVTTHITAAEEFSSCCEKLGMQLVYSCDMKDDEQLLLDLYNKMPEVDGIYITSGRSLALCEQISKLERKPALVTFDLYPELGRYIQNGTICATVYQDMYLQGYNAFSLLVRFIVDRAQPPKIYMPTPQIVLPSVFEKYISPELDLNGLDILTL